MLHVSLLRYAVVHFIVHFTVHSTAHSMSHSTMHCTVRSKVLSIPRRRVLSLPPGQSGASASAARSAQAVCERWSAQLCGSVVKPPRRPPTPSEARPLEQGCSPDP